MWSGFLRPISGLSSTEDLIINHLTNGDLLLDIYKMEKMHTIVLENAYQAVVFFFLACKDNYLVKHPKKKMNTINS